MAMLLTSRQAGERLGITAGAVCVLVRRGALPNANPNKVDGKRAAVLIDAKALKAYSESADARARLATRPAKHTNKPEAGSAVLSNLRSQLEDIHTKLDALLAIWR